MKMTHVLQLALLISTLTAGFGTLAQTFPASTRAPDPATKARVVQTFSNSPLSFEANQGPADATANFISRGSGYPILLTRTEATLVKNEAAKAALVSIAQNEAMSPIIRETTVQELGRSFGGLR